MGSLQMPCSLKPLRIDFEPAYRRVALEQRRGTCEPANQSSSCSYEDFGRSPPANCFILKDLNRLNSEAEIFDLQNVLKAIF